LPDGDDPCLSISPAVEVLFLEEVSLNIQELCDWETGELTVQISASGGSPSLTGTGAYTVSGTSLNSTQVDFGTIVTVGLGVISGQTYSYSVSDPSGCSDAFTSGPVECFKNAVELVSFEGEVQEKGNFLNWTSASETDNDYYTIERSFDGSSFEAVGQIPGAGNSIVEMHYSFLDTDTREGTFFYRLKQTEFSGLN